MRYRIAEDLAWRLWEGEVVVYAGGTGDTHYLDARTGEAFLALAREGCENEVGDGPAGPRPRFSALWRKLAAVGILDVVES